MPGHVPRGARCGARRLSASWAGPARAAPAARRREPRHRQAGHSCGGATDAYLPGHCQRRTGTGAPACLGFAVLSRSCAALCAVASRGAGAARGLRHAPVSLATCGSCSPISGTHHRPPPTACRSSPQLQRRAAASSARVRARAAPGGARRRQAWTLLTELLDSVASPRRRLLASCCPCLFVRCLCCLPPRHTHAHTHSHFPASPTCSHPHLGPQPLPGCSHPLTSH